jgi:hypothetical protein
VEDLFSEGITFDLDLVEVTFGSFVYLGIDVLAYPLLKRFKLQLHLLVQELHSLV